MKRLLTTAAVLLTAISVMADDKTVSSPDGRLQVTVSTDDGRAYYTVSYDQSPVMTRSRLGLVASHADFSEKLTLTGEIGRAHV